MKQYEYMVKCIATDPDNGKYCTELPITATSARRAANKAVKIIYDEYGHRAYVHGVYNKDEGETDELQRIYNR